MSDYGYTLLKDKNLKPLILERAIKYRRMIFDKSEKDKIPIYESEVNIIREQDGNDLQRLLFVILVWKKFSSYNNVPCEDREIARLAGVTGTNKTIGITLDPVSCEDYWSNGYLLRVKNKSRNKSFYTVLFEEKDETKKPLFYVNDIEECIYLFPKYFRDGNYCERCDNKIVKNGNNQRYCDKCAKEIRREKVALNVRNLREKRKQEQM